jgi:hypothetical protein
MKSVEEIEDLIKFKKGYIKGQSESFAPDKEKIEIAKIEINLMEYLLEYTVIAIDKDEKNE